MPTAQEYLTKAYELIDAEELRGGAMTDGERREVEDLLAKARVDNIGRQLGAPGWSAGATGYGATPGEMFVQSEQFKKLSDPSSRGQQWTTGAVPVGSPWQTKGTLMETGGYGGGGLVSVPQVVPGVVEQLFQPLSVEQSLGAAQTTSPTVRYITESTATSAAAGVLEGSAKPESTLGFDYVDEKAKKIATFLPLSEETLADAPAIQMFVNSRLMLFVAIETERQLVRGAASSAEVQGLLTSRGVPVFTGSTATDGNKAAQLFRAMNSMRGSAFIEPEWVLIHPDDYEEMRLSEDQNGQLYGGGPFFGPYGQATQADASGQITTSTDQLWGKPCRVTPAVGSGTAIVGTSAAATVFSRGGPTVEATKSHSNFFQLNLVAIRCERRLALAVLRPTGFVEVRLA